MEAARARIELTAALRWSHRMGWTEAVGNHFSLALGGGRFLINPNQRHFGLLRPADLVEVDANDPTTLDRPDAPDPTAWGLHGAIHRLVSHAACLMHLHPIHSTVLASLAESHLPPIDQNSAMFFGRHVVDEDYGGFAFEEEGVRVAGLLADPGTLILVMGNHGILSVGPNVAETFHRLYYFERAAETYIRALATGRPLRVMPGQVAETVARSWEGFAGFAEAHLAEIVHLLDRDEPGWR